MTAISIPHLETLRLPKTLEQLVSRVMRRFHEHLGEHNQSQDPDLGLGTHLRTPHIKAFEAIMYKYLPHFRGTVNSPIWADSDKVPHLNITRRSLGNLCGCKPRNAYNMLARLSKAGLINVETNVEISKNGHKIFSGYKIEPNLWLVAGLEEFKPEIVIFEDALDILPDTRVWQSLPYEKGKENKNNSYKAESVHCLPQGSQGRDQKIYQERAQNENPDPNLQTNSMEFVSSSELIPGGGENEGVENKNSLDLDKYWEEKENEEARATRLREKFYGKKEVGVQKPQQEIIIPTITKGEKQALLLQFWKYAEASLYPGAKYEGEALQNVLQVIYENVFNHFWGNADYIYWKTFVLTRMAEVDMLVKHNEKYDRCAFAPKQYFSKMYKTRGGFLSAVEWTKIEKRRYKDNKADALLLKAKNSLILGRPPRGMKDKITSIQALVEYWAKRISQSTNTYTLKQYYHFVSIANLTKTWN